MSANNTILVPQYKYEDFNTEEPYKWVVQFKSDEFDFTRYTNIIAEQAKNVGFTGFKSMLKSYISRQPKVNIVSNNVIAFDDLPTEDYLELISGDWRCNNYGVFYYDKRLREEVQVCMHPIIPIQRLKNIESGKEKIKLAFTHDEIKPHTWRTLTVDKNVLASANKIVTLATDGVAVNSENARYLVRYLTEIENLNYSTIPTLYSAERLGWVDGFGFSPFFDDLEFDGEENYRQLFNSIVQNGSLDAWVQTIREIRKECDPSVRVLMAAAFASVLVKPCDCLSFFTHIHANSEAGKSVALMVAVSVWADPEKGRYWRTFNGTTVGYEQTSGFLNCLPLCIDELQTKNKAKTTQEDIDQIIYELSEGVGRTRGARQGGVQNVKSWHNIIITTGEEPITGSNSQGGALNRTIEVRCDVDKIFRDPNALVGVLKSNYGYAGRKWVEFLSDSDNLREVIEKRKEIFASLSGATDKQLASVSLLLVADYYIEQLFFNDGILLTPEYFRNSLITSEEIDRNEQALEFLRGFAASNASHFINGSTPEPFSPVYGTFVDDYICIIDSVFETYMAKSHFSSKSFLAWAQKRDLLMPDKDGRKKVLRSVQGTKVRCVCIKKNTDPTIDEQKKLDEAEYDLPL